MVKRACFFIHNRGHLFTLTVFISRFISALRIPIPLIIPPPQLLCVFVGGGAAAH